MEDKLEQAVPSHDGHRNRMRERFEKHGAAGMSSADVLEILLFESIPRADTRELSEKLLKKFGTFSRVVGAPVSELVKIKGIGNRTAEFLHMLSFFARYYMDDVSAFSRRVFDIQSAYDLMKSKFMGRTRECVVVLILNSRGNVMFNDVITEGSISQVPVYVRELVQLCIQYDADTVILGHNHTSGNPVPSRGDVVATKELQLALDGIYVSLEDHIIFTDADYTSMRKSGWLSDVTTATEHFRKNTILSAREAEEGLELEP